MTDLLTMYEEAVYKRDHATTAQERTHWALVALEIAALELELELAKQEGC